MNNKKLYTNLVQTLWVGLKQERIDQVVLVSIEYLWKQLGQKKKVFKEWVYEIHEVMCEIR
jgi:hypothetical protein